MEVREAYLDRIKECFPELVISSVQSNMDGLVNDILIINEDLVFRFPKNDHWARRLLANEIKVLDLVRKYTDMRVPVFEHIEDDFVVYRFIKGNALQRNDILLLSDSDQDRIVERLAVFLRRFHNIPMAEIEDHDISQSDVNRSPDVWIRLYENVKRELFPHMMNHAKEWFERHYELILKDDRWMEYEPKLVNGDFVTYHILFDRGKKEINGVIDFGTAGIGDPAADFACVINSYGESFLQRMARYYPEIGSAIDRARFWAGTLEYQWILTGLRTNNPFWFTAHFGCARDIMPIGCGWS
jgi:aminoglycoside 2''-phosphotransferase